MEEFDLVIGLHSIAEAIQNDSRRIYEIVGTEDSASELKKRVSLSGIKVTLYANHKVQEESKKYFKSLELDYHRVPGNIFLLASPLQVMDISEMYRSIEVKPEVRILCLDQISDVHNAAAITRTAAFYDVDYILIPPRKSFGFTPSFFRIASGASEHIQFVTVNKLSKTVTKLKEMGVLVVALSEHASDNISEVIKSEKSSRMALVLGKEDTGISNAVLRNCEHTLSLSAQGKIKSLNVSIASAVAMEKCFGIE